MGRKRVYANPDLKKPGSLVLRGQPGDKLSSTFTEKELIWLEKWTFHCPECKKPSYFTHKTREVACPHCK